jgi:hypothetical protein
MDSAKGAEREALQLGASIRSGFLVRLRSDNYNQYRPKVESYITPVSDPRSAFPSAEEQSEGGEFKRAHGEGQSAIATLFFRAGEALDAL